MCVGVDVSDLVMVGEEEGIDVCEDILCRESGWMGTR